MCFPDPVQDLMFKVGNETLGSSMVLNETSRVDLSCTAAGSIPAATVTVMVGDKDITKDFHKVSRVFKDMNMEI